MDRELTVKQSLFVEEYIRDFNGVRAAMRAGYNGGYKVCEAVARENLAKPRIKAAVEKAKAARSRRCRVSGDQVVDELLRIAMDESAKHASRISALKEISRMCGLGEGDDDLGDALKRVAEALKET